MRSQEIKDLATDFGLDFEKYHGGVWAIALRFRGKNVVIDVWPGKMTVGIYMHGNPQKFIRNVTEEKLVDIFDRPVTFI